MKSVDIAVVVPAFNESDNLEEFLNRLISILETLDMSWQVVCVNDDSGDNSWEILKNAQIGNLNIKLVDLSSNFGKDIALTAGFDLVSADVVVKIDMDLLDPPELIPKMCQKWRDGLELVYTEWRHREGESWGRWTGASAF